VSLQTFGGPAGQIAVMHREFVEERRWLGEKRFLHALSYCTVLPGPEAQQLAIYIGWLLNGSLGGLIAGTLFVLPGFLAILGLSLIYAAYGDTTVVEALFAGVAPAVIAIVVQAVWRLGGRTLTSRGLLAVALGAFTALAVFAVPFPLVVIGAAVIGLVGHRVSPAHWSAPPAPDPEGVSAPLVPDEALHGGRGSWRRAAVIVGVGGVLWVAPVVAVAVAFGGDSVFVDQGRFFGGAALVTFGGAYAVLAFVAQRAVEVYGWLLPGEMVRGLAMAETTPGPLIMVVQFVGFMGAYRDPGSLDPWVAGVLASVLVTWVTFVPCYVFVFLGAPHMESLRGNLRVAAALRGVMAAVVGVIANLSLFFAVHTFFDEVRDVDRGPVSFDLPVWSSIDGRALVIAVFAGVLVVRWRWSILRVIGACALVGGAWHLIVA
jgi:chromate transporter